MIWNSFFKGTPVSTALFSIIIALSVLALFLFLLKVFQFHRDEINVKRLLRGLNNALKHVRPYEEALQICNSTPGPVARVLAAALIADERGDDDLRTAIDIAALDQIPNVERYVNIISIIGFILPLLGLLGTVLGMMEALQVSTEGTMNMENISQATGLALNTTAAALAVAIPLYAANNYLVARVDSILLDMEKASYEMIDMLKRLHKTTAAHHRTEGA